MELKFTDEQCMAVWEATQEARANPSNDTSAKMRAGAGRAAIEASLPLLAPVLLGPVTDKEVDLSIRQRFMEEGLNAILAARLAKYLPKPVDPAVDAVKKMLACEVRPRSDEEYAASLVAAVRAADRQAK